MNELKKRIEELEAENKKLKEERLHIIKSWEAERNEFKRIVEK